MACESSRVRALPRSVRAACRVAATLALAAWAMAPGVARAGISFVDTFRNLTYNQTGNGNALTATGGFFSAELTATSSNNYTSVQMTYPGPGSPVNLAQVSPVLYSFTSPGLATKAALDAAFPTGTYAFNATNGPDASTSFQYLADDYAQSLPFLTGTDYAALQGMNAAGPFTFHFSPFTTGGTASSSFIFFTVFDAATKATVFDAGFLAPTTTSVTLNANTLLAGHQYGYTLDFSNRNTAPSPGADFDALLGFDVRTTGTFTTAVPEPASFALGAVGGGVLGLGLIARRRKAARVG